MKKIYLLALVCFPIGCQLEENLDPAPEEAKNPNHFEIVNEKSRIQYVKSGDIPKIINAIDNSGLSSNSKTEISREKLVIDYNNILEAKTSNGKSNFTFPVYVEDQPENEFYNLIVNRSASGDIKKPYIKKYIVFPGGT